MNLRESIKKHLRLLTEQTLPVPGATYPSPNPANARQVNWEYCDQTLMNWVAGPNSGTNAGMFFGNGNPGEGQLANDGNTPPTSNGPNDQYMTQCITLGGGNIPQAGDGFKTVEVGTSPTPYVLRDARVTSVGPCTGWGNAGNTIDLPYACGGPVVVKPDPVVSDDPCDKHAWENHAKTSFPQLASESYPLWKHHFCEYCIDGTIPQGTDSFCKCCEPTDADIDIEPTDPVLDKPIIEPFVEKLRENIKKKLRILSEEKVVNFDSPNNNFVVIAGGPGAGKSFITNNLINLDNVKNFNVDNVRVLKAKEIWGDDWEEMISTPEGYEEILDKTYTTSDPRNLTVKFLKQFLDMERNQPTNVVYDAGGGQEKVMKEVQKLAKDSGFHTTLVYVRTPLDIAQQRNLERPRSLPGDMVAQYHDQVKDNMRNMIPLFDSVWTVDNKELIDLGDRPSDNIERIK